MRLMKESGARQRWCPFARSWAWADMDERHVISSINRKDEGGPDSGCYCIASDCMAWHWAEDEDKPGQTSIYGYCGLANGNQS